MNTTIIISEFAAFREMGLNGDKSALDRLQLRFGQQLHSFISRVIRLGQGRGHLADFVISEVKRIREQHSEISREELVNEVVERACRLLSGVGFAGRVDTVSLNNEATVSAA